MTWKHILDWHYEANREEIDAMSDALDSATHAVEEWKTSKDENPIGEEYWFNGGWAFIIQPNLEINLYTPDDGLIEGEPVHYDDDSAAWVTCQMLGIDY